MEYSSAKTTKLKGGSISMGGPLLPIFVKNYSKTAGEKAYELVSHLGNVHMVISDRKVSVEDGSSGNVAYFVSDVISTNDVYPFGALQPTRVKYNFLVRIIEINTKSLSVPSINKKIFFKHLLGKNCSQKSI